jgi:ubiquinone/menaquinone biosynthesis C-methylase UbiE
MPRVLTFLITFAMVAILLRQCRRPTGWIGRLLIWSMNHSHAALTDWGLSQVTIGKAFTILDVGCGGGLAIQKLLEVASDGRVLGVDYSSASVAATRARNAEAIAAGRAEIHEGSVARLPFSDAMFDLVTAIETHYYWPDLTANLREVLRVLKPSGQLVVIAEAHADGRFGPLYRLVMKPMGGTVLSADEHRAAFAAAGYSAIDVREKGNWICVSGRK